LIFISLFESFKALLKRSQFAFNDHFSFRPTAIDNLKSDNQKGDFSLPVTYDFKPVFGKLQPYAGGGLGITAEDNTDVGGMFTAGADYPINKSVTANASVNWDVLLLCLYGEGLEQRKVDILP
jgi:hypothetical protein